MEAWLDIRAIRIPRPKLVSSLSNSTGLVLSSATVHSHPSPADISVSANSERNINDDHLDSGSVNHRALVNSGANSVDENIVIDN